jgi:hypothetical protein
MLLNSTEAVTMSDEMKAAMVAEFVRELELHQFMLRAGVIEDLGEEMRRGR